MKICPHCGEPYRDWITFCFSDGELLRAPTADEVVAVVTDARAAARAAVPVAAARVQVEAPPDRAPVPAVDPMTLALIAQVQAAVTRSVVTQRRTWWREVAARRREATARLIARVGAYGVTAGCLTAATAAGLAAGLAWWGMR